MGPPPELWPLVLVCPSIVINRMDKEKDTVLLWDCPLGIENRERIRSLFDSDVKQWQVIEKVRDRLPNWAVVIISLLFSLLSISCTLLVTQHK